MSGEHHTQAVSEDHGPWHVRAIRLPDGDRLEECWIVDGRVGDAPVAGARELPGGWFLPGGLVDAHAHLTMNWRCAMVAPS